TRALLADTVERGLELLLCLDTPRKVAADAHHHDPLAVDDAPQFGNGCAQAPLTGVAVGAKLWDRHVPLVTFLATIARLGEPAPLVLVDLRPARCHDELVEGSGARGDAFVQGRLEPATVLGLNRLRVLPDGGQLPEERLAGE